LELNSIFSKHNKNYTFNILIRTTFEIYSQGQEEATRDYIEKPRYLENEQAPKDQRDMGLLKAKELEENFLGVLLIKVYIYFYQRRDLFISY
jgi:hypothetical protein